MSNEKKSASPPASVAPPLQQPTPATMAAAAAYAAMRASLASPAPSSKGDTRSIVSSSVSTGHPGSSAAAREAATMLQAPQHHHHHDGSHDEAQRLRASLQAAVRALHEVAGQATMIQAQVDALARSPAVVSSGLSGSTAGMAQSLAVMQRSLGRFLDEAETQLPGAAAMSGKLPGLSEGTDTFMTSSQRLGGILAAVTEPIVARMYAESASSSSSTLAGQQPSSGGKEQGAGAGAGDRVALWQEAQRAAALNQGFVKSNGRYVYPPSATDTADYLRTTADGPALSDRKEAEAGRGPATAQDSDYSSAKRIRVRAPVVAEHSLSTSMAGSQTMGGGMSPAEKLRMMHASVGYAGGQGSPGGRPDSTASLAAGEESSRASSHGSQGGSRAHSRQDGGYQVYHQVVREEPAPRGDKAELAFGLGDGDLGPTRGVPQHANTSGGDTAMIAGAPAEASQKVWASGMPAAPLGGLPDGYASGIDSLAGYMSERGLSPLGGNLADDDDDL